MKAEHERKLLDLIDAGVIRKVGGLPEGHETPYWLDDREPHGKALWVVEVEGFWSERPRSRASEGVLE